MAELQNAQEVQNFVGKKGTGYVCSLATEEERKHFEGSIYHNGIPDLAFLSYLTSPSSYY